MSRKKEKQQQQKKNEKALHEVDHECEKILLFLFIEFEIKIKNFIYLFI